MHPGYYALGGEPGAGKSALAIQLALGAASKGAGVLYVSLEMSHEQVWARACACAASWLAQGTLDHVRWSLAWQEMQQTRNALNKAMQTGDEQSKREALESDRFARCAQWIGQHCPGFFVWDTPSAARLDRLIEAIDAAGEAGAALVVVDYLQLISASEGIADETQSTKAASDALQAVSKERRLPVLVLSALSKPPARADPQDFRFRGSSAIEFNAIATMRLSESTLEGDEIEQQIQKGFKPVELYIKKNRFGKGGAEARMRFFGAFNCFTEAY